MIEEKIALETNLSVQTVYAHPRNGSAMVTLTVAAWISLTNSTVHESKSTHDLEVVTIFSIHPSPFSPSSSLSFLNLIHYCERARERETDLYEVGISLFSTFRLSRIIIISFIKFSLLCVCARFLLLVSHQPPTQISTHFLSHTQTTQSQAK